VPVCDGVFRSMDSVPAATISQAAPGLLAWIRSAWHSRARRDTLPAQHHDALL
jgi:hypothetical protein